MSLQVTHDAFVFHVQKNVTRLD